MSSLIIKNHLKVLNGHTSRTIIFSTNNGNNKVEMVTRLEVEGIAISDSEDEKIKEAVEGLYNLVPKVTFNVYNDDKLVAVCGNVKDSAEIFDLL